MRNISIILGYGVFVKPNPEYQLYLNQVKKVIQKNNPDTVIVTGGFTNPSIPHLSEASSISKYLFPQSDKSNIILEEKSFTTYQNLLFSKEIIGTQLKTLDSILIIADSIRVPKVFFHALQILFGIDTKKSLTLLINESRTKNPDLLPDPISFSYQNLIVQGISLSRDPKQIAHQITDSIIESHYSEFPELHQDFIIWRKQKWGLK
ncbi:hypothetical protein COS78_03370 [Candidatus Shapirobacteria bacterium CG06_land_8_20_14_3_00_40_12]|uniref:DUF218 domain-containing protein n=1 Tax=Candidatus Shapirobacteria bacterium CG06_land_8_20_14_3_00_40_12 TaxID=1974881 RepID=A0A2M7ARL3_9BACT|nr:MAG: hypothetical protein COS78_03370 [Candidatus Shapirobacteria bacterium CG06_land_8_20_14_3_00_40_12]